MGDNLVIRSVVGRNIVINNVDGDMNVTYGGNSVTINGQVVTMEDRAPIYITVEGDVKGSLKTQSGKVEVYGSVSGNVGTQSGDVSVTGDVSQYVSTMSGDVVAKSIGGNVSTMSGDIIKR